LAPSISIGGGIRRVLAGWALFRPAQRKPFLAVPEKVTFKDLEGPPAANEPLSTSHQAGEAQTVAVYVRPTSI